MSHGVLTASDEELVGELVLRAGGKSLALLLVGRVLELAVQYEDRATIEARLGAKFTDEEWKALLPAVEGFSQDLDSRPGYAELVAQWCEDIVAEAKRDAR